MPKLQSLYKEYVQKSRLFLYPALDIKRGVSVTPVQTYVSWEGRYKASDMKLVCLYHLRTDKEFILFESKKLREHPLFHRFLQTSDEQGVYVFDFSKYSTDWQLFLKGRYSKLSDELKKKIRTFYGTNALGYIDSFLYPERYFSLYAELLTFSKADCKNMHGILTEVGELCSIPDFEQENLSNTVENLQEIKKIP